MLPVLRGFFGLFVTMKNVVLLLNNGLNMLRDLRLGALECNPMAWMLRLLRHFESKQEKLGQPSHSNTAVAYVIALQICMMLSLSFRGPCGAITPLATIECA